MNIICLGISYFAHRYIGGQIPLNFKILGYIIIVIALYNIIRTLSLVRLNRSAKKMSTDANTLIKSGPFKYSRNPIYLGFLLILIGLALVLGSFSGFLGGFFYFLIADLWSIPNEEQKLIQIFGESYLTYKRQVRKWL